MMPEEEYYGLKKCSQQAAGSRKFHVCGPLDKDIYSFKKNIYFKKNLSCNNAFLKLIAVLPS